MNTNYTEDEVLEQFDLAISRKLSKYYPTVREQDIRYNFFPDLEHGYRETAGNRIHLYADSTRWAVVFEINGYQNRSISAEIELLYFGNCIDYPIDKYSERNYIANSSRVSLIDPSEYERIENKEGEEMETFELIGKNITEIKIRGEYIPFENDYKKYEALGIKIRDYENPKKLISFGDIVRYISDTNPKLISATEDEIKLHIPKNLPKLMTINEYHFISAYDESIQPSKQETYKLIAKIILTKDTSNWKPSEKPNNHWTNWESGNL